MVIEQNIVLQNLKRIVFSFFLRPSTVYRNSIKKEKTNICHRRRFEEFFPLITKNPFFF